VRKVTTRAPSFPDAPTQRPLQAVASQVWQVLCGDTGHWRVGLYSPSATSPDPAQELERHDCPELFVLLQGRLTLTVLEPDGVREIALSPGVPVLVSAPHAGYCPTGPHGGSALVVERDSFDTEYKTAKEWAAG
jgi:hypothetical protein